MSIPDWNIHGIVPPIRPGRDGGDPDRSPYCVDLRIFIERFARSTQRHELLRGLLAFRRALAQAGITEGFQWLDGSFLEDVERTRGKAPGDIDVVTFAALGDAANQKRLWNEYSELFDSRQLRSRYRVDHYFVNLSTPRDATTVRRVSYWYSMWSHRRADQMWKGFVEVALNPDDDASMLEYLNGLDATTPLPGAAP